MLRIRIKKVYIEKWLITNYNSLILFTCEQWWHVVFKRCHVWLAPSPS